MDVEVIRSMLGAVPKPWLSGLEHVSGLDWVQRALERYLSVTHRDQQQGCAYPAVLGDGRAPDEVGMPLPSRSSARRVFEAHLPPRPDLRPASVRLRPWPSPSAACFAPYGAVV